MQQDATYLAIRTKRSTKMLELAKLQSPISWADLSYVRVSNDHRLTSAER